MKTYYVQVEQVAYITYEVLADGKEDAEQRLYDGDVDRDEFLDYDIRDEVVINIWTDDDG